MLNKVLKLNIDHFNKGSDNGSIDAGVRGIKFGDNEEEITVGTNEGWVKVVMDKIIHGMRVVIEKSLRFKNNVLKIQRRQNPQSMLNLFVRATFLYSSSKRSATNIGREDVNYA